MFCYHQNTKLGIVTFGPTISPFLMMTKHMSYLKENLGKSFVKAPPQVMLAIKYKIYDKGIV